MSQGTDIGDIKYTNDREKDDEDYLEKDPRETTQEIFLEMIPSLLEIVMLEEKMREQKEEIPKASLGRLDRLEDLIKEMRDELDDLREWKVEVDERGCKKC
ncbi:hypothetical protein HOY80DRAFT_1047634 [Tuber brumale]|nr:hypothetical protein HOY80DRAFT_1047634 [Tuber brumale]